MTSHFKAINHYTTIQHFPNKIPSSCILLGMNAFQAHACMLTRFPLIDRSAAGAVAD